MKDEGWGSFEMQAVVVSSSCSAGVNVKIVRLCERDGLTQAVCCFVAMLAPVSGMYVIHDSVRFSVALPSNTADPPNL